MRDGFHPIVFCRFIPTAEYVAASLRDALPKGVEVAAVTGLLPPDEREARVARARRRASVASSSAPTASARASTSRSTFDAVVHYDLSWNPTRHEQREGRVDRYGQAGSTVRVVTYYGVDNQIDGIVLDVLLRKHKTIRDSLGISVPVPVDTEQVMAALLHGALLRGEGAQLALGLSGAPSETHSKGNGTRRPNARSGRAPSSPSTESIRPRWLRSSGLSSARSDPPWTSNALRERF